MTGYSIGPGRCDAYWHTGLTFVVVFTAGPCVSRVLQSVDAMRCVRLVVAILYL